MNRPCGIIVLLLVAVIAVMTWFFVIRGSGAKGEDGRTVIMLSPSDRAFFLAEMRSWLEAVQAISAALADNDVQAAAREAARAGRVDMSLIPGSLLRALPGEMKQLGLGTHAAFRDMAHTLQSGASPQQGMKMLSSILLNCTGCHAGYRVDPAGR